MSLSAGDQGYRVTNRSVLGDLSSSPYALAMVSGDNFFLTRPGANPGPVPRQTVRPSLLEGHRATARGRNPTRTIKGREEEGQSRGRPARFSPYPSPGFKRDLSDVQQRL
ncbi:uncharacterized protein C11orf71 homolog [Rhynchocyon petersi]